MFGKIFKTSEISQIDAYTIEHEKITSLELMDRAARRWVVAFHDAFPDCRNACVVAGRGNNGGDGFVVGRYLSELYGVQIEIYLLPGTSALSDDCAYNKQEWEQLGGFLRELSNVDEFQPDKDEIIIDAMFGSGLNRLVNGLASEVIKKINQLPNIVASIDVPSGLMGEDNSGNDEESIIQADFTYTFQFPKLSFLFPENEKYVGIWKVLDIKLHPDIIQTLPSEWNMLTDEVSTLLPPFLHFAHKGTNGHGLLIAGSYGMMGAAQLSARAALRSGIGLLSCHVPQKGVDIIQIAAPEALVDIDVHSQYFTQFTLPMRCTAVAVGPGIGKHSETVDALRNLLNIWSGTIILDADALNILAESPDMLSLLHERCILTPHLGEFERLVGKSNNHFERLNKLSKFARLHKVTVVLKGAYTAIAASDGRLFFNPTGNPGMAKGGMGDVLTGVMLALAANGLEPLQVAMVGVYAHGLAGDFAAERLSERGVHAETVVDALYEAWIELNQTK